MSERLAQRLGKMEGDIDDLQERLDYLCTKREKVQEQLEHIVDSMVDELRQMKDHRIEKLNDLFATEKQKILLDMRDKQQLVADTKECMCKVRELRGSQSEEEASEIEKSVEQKNNQHELAYDDEKPRLVDLNLNVQFAELLAFVQNLPLGDVQAMYNDRDKKGNVSDTYVDLGRTQFMSGPSTSICSEDYGEEPFIGRAVHVSTIHTRVESDRADPKLNDIAVVEVEDIVAIVVTDRANKCVKSFYTRDKLHFYSTETATKQPKGIARVGTGRVGVTFPDSESIKFLKVTPALRRDKEIKTTKQYRGIAMLDLETLVVSTYKTFPGSVDLLDFGGRLLRSITNDQSGESMFAYPFYLCTNLQRHIIVSDCERKTVTCMSEFGKVIFQYGHGGDVEVDYPLGVAFDTFGDIMLADCDNHKVVKILGDGQGVKEFLGKGDGIWGPYSIDVDQFGAFYVAQWNGDVKKFSLD